MFSYFIPLPDEIKQVSVTLYGDMKDDMKDAGQYDTDIRGGNQTHCIERRDHRDP